MRRNTHFIWLVILPVVVPGALRRNRCASIVTWLVLALLASGCSGGSLLGTPSATATGTSAAPPASGSPSFKDKISSFFSGSTTIGPTGTKGDTDNNGAMAVRYQGTFVRAARECALVSGNVVMKVGVEGRIIVGPAGGPGQVDVPLRIAVVEETAAHTKPIVTKFARIPVTVASATDNPTFTHIDDDVTFPMPSNLDNYIVYIGFDPLAAQAQDRPKPAAKPKPKAKPTAKTG